MSTFRYKVSFRVRHPNMAPDEICSALGLTARFQWAAGSPRQTQTAVPLEGYHESTYCSFLLEHPEGMELAKFLSRNNKALSLHKEFLKGIRDTGGTLEYFIGWYTGVNSGEVFTSELLRELADLQINLAFDVYAENK